MSNSKMEGWASSGPVERSGDGAMYSAVYPAAVVVADRARETVEMLMARLPAGPSNRGAGH